MNADLAFRDYIEQVRERTEIVDIVRSRIPLNRARKACCPFHEDSTPSFSVHQKGQYFHCFGCGVAGDAFRFLEMYDGLSFSEAVAHLAVEAGIPAWESGSGPIAYRSVPRPAHRVLPIDEVLSRPDRAEVEAVWESAGPITEDAEAMGWFCYRYRYHAEIIAQGTEMWDLARVVRPGAVLPGWARCGRFSWAESSHRLIFKLFDHFGVAVSLRARCLNPAGDPKSLVPAGFAAKGLILADPLGVQILAGAVPEWWESKQVIISEGEPDWLSWASRQSDAHEEGPAYMGIVSGGWSHALADRIPDGAAVSIRTDHDVAGNGYASKIAETLAGRCQLYRNRSEEEVAV